ncbi:MULTISPECIES: hypothetical protein [Bacillaceae]|uniref:Uncharacterized protein n=1 Tax=Metabacillus halosaccharovorans TaxID=930124 RepID=A0ABT3DQE4_9BACI|nr:MULTISPECIES: hypothetical protein [Bacillaceae]MCV9888786.1 hypothetical protein [Metabacillus halosaccharovorans]
MGYILPIQHDTYTQYANRSVSVQQHYAHVLPTSAITLNTRHLRESPQAEQQKFADILKDKMKQNKYIATYTGKGNHLNEYV